MSLSTVSPDGYDTYIEQGGTNVSGGQKQRLCIARALLKNPKVLILDDSTSAVDTRTDALIRQGMREYLPETTKIIIAQRVSSVQDADRIVVLTAAPSMLWAPMRHCCGTTPFTARFTSPSARQVTKMRINNPSAVGGTLRRLASTLFSFYPGGPAGGAGCILFNAVISSLPSVVMQNIIAQVELAWADGDWSAVSGRILFFVGLLALLYVLSLLASFTYTRMMAVITQGTLEKLRERCSAVCRTCPFRYFDTNSHGDVMSHYTNDIDTLRQMISQSFPQLMISAVTVCTIFFIMIYYSVWMALVVLVGVAVMIRVTRVFGSKSARFFIRQQQALGVTEGFVEEMMNGQKVIKVFCHEEQSERDFDKLNDQLFSDAEQANNTPTPGPHLEQHRQPALCGGGAGRRPDAAAGHAQYQPVRPGAEHQHRGAVSQYDQAVFRQHRPGVPPDQRRGHGPGRGGAHLRHAG